MIFLSSYQVLILNNKSLTGGCSLGKGARLVRQAELCS